MALFVATVAIYSITNYGGVRSPDSEVVFRLGESLASLRGIDVDPLAIGPHGVAPGNAEKTYSVYPPVQSVVLAPLIATAQAVNATPWHEEDDRVPVSFYVGTGLVAFLFDADRTAAEAHALRFIVSLVNPVIGAAIVLLFYLVVDRMARSRIAALAVSILYAFGTLEWHYAGTYFSEQLGLLFVLLSFLIVVRGDPRFEGASAGPSPPALLSSGVLLALAFGTHVTAVLFAPFMAWYAYNVGRTATRDSRRALRLTAWLLAGYAIVTVLLGAYNFARFGSILETGRTVSADQSAVYAWRTLTTPFHGLRELLIGSSKGLLLFNPAVMLGVLTWPWLHRRNPALSWILAAAILFRIALISSLTIWHGGFCLGPRYLVMLIPFMLLPVAPWLGEQVRNNRTLMFSIFAALTVVLAAQQLYFTVGDIFGFSHLIVWSFEARRVNVFENDRIYVDWKLSPLHQLHNAPRAPFLLRDIEWRNLALWRAGAAVLSVALSAAFLALWRTRPG